MNNHINALLLGFLIFIVGLIVFNFDIMNYKYVDYLPTDFEMNVEKITFNIRDDMKYKVKKAKYNDNIILEKNIVNNGKENEITIEITHSNTSDVYNAFTTNQDDVEIVFSNALNMSSDDIKPIYNLIIKCIKDKTIYNYNLLKYSKITIKGSEQALSKIEIEDYAI